MLLLRGTRVPPRLLVGCVWRGSPLEDLRNPERRRVSREGRKGTLPQTLKPVDYCAHFGHG
jgi:hypothetical protein